MEDKDNESKDVTKKVFNKEKFKSNFTIPKIMLGIIGVIAVIVIILFLNKEEKTKNIEGTELSKIGYTVRESEEKQIKLVDYDSDNFKMKIPEGWEVSTAGDGMYFAIRAYDPKDDRYQIYSVLKAEPLLKNQQAKDWYESYYKSFGGEGNKLLAKAIVLQTATADSFYSNFNNYINFVKTMGTTFNAPDLNNFKTIETFENNSQLNRFAADDKILRGTFQDTKTGKNGEGLFMATIINQGSNYTLGYDVMYYTAYNVMGISAGEYDFINYEDILTESLNSLEYKDKFINTTIKNIENTTEQSLSLDAGIQQAYDSYNSAWSTRQKTYDITSQKYSDATLGYERVYNTDTGEIYKAYNGFYDDYAGNTYKPITDDMYAEKVEGYIEK